MATILEVNRNYSARIWNVGRNHVRPTGQLHPKTGEPILAPVYIKWGTAVVQIPARGEFVDRDVRGRPLTPKIVAHLIIHHEGLSDKAPVIMTAPENRPSMEEIAAMGVSAPAPNPVLEQAAAALDVDETVAEDVAVVEAAVKTPAAKSKPAGKK